MECAEYCKSVSTTNTKIQKKTIHSNSQSVFDTDDFTNLFRQIALFAFLLSPLPFFPMEDDKEEYNAATASATASAAASAPASATASVNLEL